MKASTNTQQIPSKSMGRGALLPVSTVLLLAAVLAILLAAGCGESPGTQQQNEELQQRVDELEEQREQEEKAEQQQQNEELQQRVDELEEQNEGRQVVIGAAAPEGRVVIAPDATYAGTTREAAALEAAIAYYEAVELGDYTYTYNALHSSDQDKYSYDEWVFANEQLDSAAGEFEIFLIEETSGSAEQVRVGLTVYLADGSSSDRYTYFYYEDGAWRHYLTMEEYEIFDSVL